MKCYYCADGHECSAFTILAPIFLRTFVLAQADVPKCYYPNGLRALNDFACNLDSNTSACCKLGHICLDNGTCEDKSGRRHRGTCTDLTWSSPECAQYCLENDYNGAELKPCRNVTSSNLDYCCFYSINCCDTGIGRFRLKSAGKPTTIIRSNAITAARRISSTTSTPSSSPIKTSARAFSTLLTPPDSTFQSVLSKPTVSSEPTSSSGLDPGAKTGIGVAAGAVSAILVLALILSWWWKRKRTNSPSTTPPGDMRQQSLPEGPRELPGEQHHEMPVGNLDSELPGEQHHEMPVGNLASELPEENMVFGPQEEHRRSRPVG